ncbi:MAG TPA: L-rhamnose mutarotase [Leeuwenhoekiella sp.]|nr:L-rhamnose mutarotase [Leeuwenhoekiella sp.]
MMTRRFCFACDLKDQPELIAEYRMHHAKENARPEITASIRDAGIVDMQIYLLANRLFMIMEVDETFDAEKKKKMDAENPKVQEWEKLMWKFQQEPPGAKPGEKWVEMERIFKL